jgi:hypothetical protein
VAPQDHDVAIAEIGEEIDKEGPSLLTYFLW